MRTFWGASERLAPAGAVRTRPAGVARRRASLLSTEARIFESLVDPALLDAAARRADALGVGVDEVLRCHGILSPDLIASALAEQLGVFLDPLREDDPATRLDVASKGVFVRRGTRGEELITVAPRGNGIRRFAAAIAREPRLAAHLRITSPERLSNHVRKVFRPQLTQQAVNGLRTSRPDLSAARYGRDNARWFAAAAGTAMIAALLFADELTACRDRISSHASFYFVDGAASGGVRRVRYTRTYSSYSRSLVADLHHHRTASRRGGGRGEPDRRVEANRLSAGEARYQTRARGGRPRDARRGCEDWCRGAVRNHRAPAVRSAHEAESARKRPALRTRLVRRGIRCRRRAGAGPVAQGTGCVCRWATGTRLRASASRDRQCERWMA